MHEQKFSKILLKSLLISDQGNILFPLHLAMLKTYMHMF